MTLLAFGDSGYHYDHLEAADYDDVVTMEQFIEAERKDWIEDKRPIEELAYPPVYSLPRNGSSIAASGLAPVATAMKNFCREQGCSFATMLGDNLYPDGATAGADGRDAQRFRDLFTVPFAPLAEGRDDFRIYTVLGNHDWHTSREGAMAQVRFLEASPPFYMQGLFYRVVPPAARGQVEIFAIDTEVLLAGTTVYEPALADDGSALASNSIEAPEQWAVPQGEAERNMAAWLETALASSSARWKVVIGHHPLWSSAGSKFEQAKALRRLILPVLCRHADIYIAGHEHTLEVHTDDCSTAALEQKVAPLPTVVSGSASKMRPTNSAFIRHQSKAHPQLRTLWAKGLVWGFAHLTFSDDRVTVRMVETPGDGSGVSQVTFERSFARRSAAE
ncbi:MAG TPA: metallophosphoesterase [Gemmatimonadaceae bacterium]|nr:metallophosphoesterase [Gemmatimonadaceae bacterium]